MDASASFGEEGGRLSYGGYLALGELLQLQRPQTGAHDELLFITIHQVYELWFKLVLHELEAARDSLFAGDVALATHRLRRVAAIEEVLIAQVAVLNTMRPQDFLAFRTELAPASGFQSVQFREIEFLSGAKDPGYLDRIDMTDDERVRLERRLAEPSLWDAFREALHGRGDPSLLAINSDREHHLDLFELTEAMLDHDEAVERWRTRHVQMVERQLGDKHGTGGSTGAQYLRGTLGKRFFPDLWAVRSQL
jgi:tryptophan 2,3-dioxygenase